VFDDAFFIPAPANGQQALLSMTTTEPGVIYRLQNEIKVLRSALDGDRDDAKAT